MKGFICDVPVIILYEWVSVCVSVTAVCLSLKQAVLLAHTLGSLRVPAKAAGQCAVVKALFLFYLQPSNGLFTAEDSDCSQIFARLGRMGFVLQCLNYKRQEM